MDCGDLWSFSDVDSYLNATAKLTEAVLPIGQQPATQLSLDVLMYRLRPIFLKYFKRNGIYHIAPIWFPSETRLRCYLHLFNGAGMRTTRRRSPPTVTPATGTALLLVSQPGLGPVGWTTMAVCVMARDGPHSSTALVQTRTTATGRRPSSCAAMHGLLQ